MDAPSAARTQALREGGGPAAWPGAAPRQRPVTVRLAPGGRSAVAIAATDSCASRGAAGIGVVSRDRGPGRGWVGVGAGRDCGGAVVVSAVATGGAGGDVPGSPAGVWGGGAAGRQAATATATATATA